MRMGLWSAGFREMYGRMVTAAAVMVVICGTFGSAAVQAWDIGPAENPSAVTATLSGGTLTISGMGAMRDFEWNGQPWYNVRSSITIVVIGNGVTTIGDWAFYGCTALTSITIPNSVITIGDMAFSGCFGLASVTIGNNVATIRQSAFQNCTGLTSVTSLNPGPPTMGSNVFTNINVNACLYVPHNSLDAYLLASGWGHQFGCIYSLHTVTFNSQGGSDVTSQTIAQGSRAAKPADPILANHIFDGWYQDTSYLNAWDFDTDVVTSNITLFARWTHGWHCGFPIASDVIATLSGGTLTISGTGAIADFNPSRPWDSYRDSITNVIIDDGITIIGMSAFEGCINLTSVIIPNSVTNIGHRAFFYCSSLNSVIIGNGVIFIADNAFAGCTGLTSINIPDGVLSIGNWAFAGCTGLTSIVIPNSVTSIGYNAFQGCTSLTSVIIGSGVTIFGSQYNPRADIRDVFYYCNSLISVVSLNPVPPIALPNLHNKLDKTFVHLYVPQDNIADYASADYWSEFGSIKAIDGFTLLTVSTGTLSPEFDPAITSYTLTVSNAVSVLTINATPVYAEATVIGVGEKLLNIGENTYEIEVSAFSYARTYTLTVTREPPIAVTDITNVPTTVTVSVPFEAFPLQGTVVPEDATNKTIVWSIVLTDNIDTDAAIFDSLLYVTVEGIVRVKATIENGTAIGTDFEKIFNITVEKEVSILSPDRVIPPSSSDTAAVVVAPINLLAGQFSAGPNPVDRQSGGVAFYWNGRMLSGGMLFVYDASGNVVNRVVINGDVGALRATPLNPALANRRQIGTWDLTDGRGRPISDGTYLIRGTLTIADGSRERVSLMVGVR